MSFTKIDENSIERPEGKNCILAYGYSQEENSIINEFSKKIGIEHFIHIPTEKTHHTLEELVINNLDNSTSISKINEKAIVFNAVSDKELNEFISKFKLLNLQRPLFAVVTPTSKSWKFIDLITELMKEREEFKKLHTQNK
ncbi:uncharacterized protein DUF3783 [Hypnocyclicus thermotrophus]|uniref:Uncharacterized protein DUF3783 n=1 Tax=Hypnocyclicus thermotrophus TaxID=1627895 RepID=A0AA46DWZ7_9FUSO|nr:DUF3783 domain-containing protein [Hypnocyclicus thermotrophus]TDT67340.1 uncharacterized protein DUF3783 [Hypnocyclicus thermotrophus]